MIYLITYELRSNRSYEPFYTTIKSYSKWWHYLDRTWLVKSVDSSEQIYEKLKPTLDNADSVFVVEINPQAGHYFGRLNAGAWEWIKKNR